MSAMEHKVKAKSPRAHCENDLIITWNISKRFLVVFKLAIQHNSTQYKRYDVFTWLLQRLPLILNKLNPPSYM